VPLIKKMSSDSDRFVLGINYWPSKKGMYWWKRYDHSEVKNDFSLIKDSGFSVIRIFLLWEDFQPEPSRVPLNMVKNLVDVADIAKDTGVKIMPTFFTGHMSGANWLPDWMLTETSEKCRFPVITNGRIRYNRIRNFYNSKKLMDCQKLQIGAVAGALKGHKAIWAWDLGNENSNYVIPLDNMSAANWLKEMAYELKYLDEQVLVTIGLHQEDLEEDRNMGPREAAEYCDFLSIHGYSTYASWCDGITDEKVPVFLGFITRWLGGIKEIKSINDVLIEEFGICTCPANDKLKEKSYYDAGDISLISEDEAEIFYDHTLDLIRKLDFKGAFLWCFADYDESLWNMPPFDKNIHERFFGIFRDDGSPKRSLNAIQRFISQKKETMKVGLDWIDINSEDFYGRPRKNLIRLFKRFKSVLKVDMDAET
jgi:endo-1,4-beta-mannosidase